MHVLFNIKQKTHYFNHLNLNKLNVTEKEKSDFLKAVGEKLKKIRIEKNLTEQQLSEICNVDAKIIKEAECGEIDIRISKLLAIADGLGANIKLIFAK